MPDSFFLMSQGKNVSFSLHRVSGFLHRVSAFYTDYAADYDTDNRAIVLGHIILLYRISKPAISAIEIC